MGEPPYLLFPEALRITLTAFENFEFISDSVVIDRVKSFKYLGVTTDEKWSWKPI